MDQYGWELFGMDRVHKLAQADPDYGALRRKWEVLLPEYQRILESLSPEDWAVLVDYACVTGDMQFAETKLAYNLGRRVGILL